MKRSDVSHAIDFVQRKCPVLTESNAIAETGSAALAVVVLQHFCSYMSINSAYLSDWPKVLPFAGDMPERKYYVVNVGEAKEQWDAAQAAWKEAIAPVLYVLGQHTKKGNEYAGRLYEALSSDSIALPEDSMKIVLDQNLGYAPDSELFHAARFVSRHGNISGLEAEVLRELTSYDYRRSGKQPAIPAKEKLPSIIQSGSIIQRELVSLAKQEEQGTSFGDEGVAARYNENVTFIANKHGFLPEVVERKQSYVAQLDLVKKSERGTRSQGFCEVLEKFLALEKDNKANGFGVNYSSNSSSSPSSSPSSLEVGRSW